MGCSSSKQMNGHGKKLSVVEQTQMARDVAGSLLSFSKKMEKSFVVMLLAAMDIPEESLCHSYIIVDFRKSSYILEANTLSDYCKTYLPKMQTTTVFLRQYENIIKAPMNSEYDKLQQENETLKKRVKSLKAELSESQPHKQQLSELSVIVEEDVDHQNNPIFEAQGGWLKNDDSTFLGDKTFSHDKEFRTKLNKPYIMHGEEIDQELN